MSEFLVDTNVILRLLVGDVEDQLTVSKRFFRKVEEGKATALVSILVVNELVWILENFYDLKRKDYVHSLLQLFSLKNVKILEISKRDLVSVLEEMLLTRLDFTDLYLKFCYGRTKKKVKSFDKQLIRDCAKVIF